jgi:hypothetical protein
MIHALSQHCQQVSSLARSKQIGQAPPSHSISPQPIGCLRDRIKKLNAGLRGEREAQAWQRRESGAHPILSARIFCLWIRRKREILRRWLEEPALDNFVDVQS